MENENGKREKGEIKERWSEREREEGKRQWERERKTKVG